VAPFVPKINEYWPHLSLCNALLRPIMVTSTTGTEQNEMTNTMQKGDIFTENGVEYRFINDSKRNGGGVYCFAQLVSAQNVQIKQIAYADVEDSMIFLPEHTQ